MMFVFHVDQGRMLTFKMECMFEDIRRLKELIERNHAIPARSIVLLVSGGELLEDESRACHYATGTDTNPIYMFCKTVGESPLLSPGPIKETEVDLDGLVRKSLELPVTFAGMAARAQLAQRIYEMGREELRRCESLIHEQHLQQQGWAAVVANMEDTIKEFQERCEYFNRYYEEQLRMYEEQMDILHSFDKSLQQLADIPILSSLMENAESRPYGVFDEVFNPSRAGSNTDQQSSSAAGGSGGGGGSGGVILSTSAGGPPPGIEGNPDGDTVTEEGQKGEATGSGTELATVEDGGGEVALTEGERAKGISLLDWISAMEGQLTLKRMAEECRINIEKFNRNLLVNLNDRIEKAVKASQNVDIKVVKGLEERLRGLDELLAKAKKQLSDQNGLAEGIAKNQQSASKINDASVLPQLCVSHQNTLQLMKKNHADLLEYKRRCTVAKEELGLNLTKRIKYIMNVETRVHELDSTLQLYHTSLQRLQKHLSIIEQIHMVPCIYVSAVTEVVRRRMFSSAFLRWASDLACRLMAIHNEEVARRQDFTSIFEGHFLSSLFPGMTDMPPSYAIQAPSVFDSSLPALDKQDLEELSRYLPELTEKIPLPNIASVIDFFQTRSVEQQQLQQQDDGSGTGKDDASVRSKDGATSSSDNAAEQQSGGKESDKVGAESETDTEDYEKVQNQSPVGGRSTQEEAPAATVVETCSVATCTEPVETVCAETLTEVRYDDDTYPPNVTTITGTNTTTPTNTVASCMHATNTLTSATTTTTTASADNVAIASVEHGGGEDVSGSGGGKLAEQQPAALLPGYHHPATILEENAASPAAGIVGSSLDGRCPLYVPASTLDGGRRLRRGILTRTSSSERSSSSQELLLLALMEPSPGSTALLRSPGDEGEFINSEFYIDESLPSSAASVERRQQLEHTSHQPYQQHQQQQQLYHQHQEFRASFADCLLARGRSSYDEGTVILLLQDNLGTTRLEVERLKGLLSSVYQLSQDSIMMLRDQLARVRAEADSNRTQFQSELGAMNRAWNDIQQLARNRERETIQQLTVDHELEMNDLRKSIHHKDDEIQSLRSDNSTMKASHIETVSSYEQEKRELSDQIAQMREVIRRLEEQLASAEVDRRKAIQEAIEQLEHKHRTEMESLRCRFKLMATSMDRSPSDTSLEKIEKPDMIDIGTHEQLLAQVRLDLQREKEQAIKAAVEEERQRWEANAIGGGGSSIVGSAGSAGNHRLHRSYGAAGSPGTGSQDVYKRILDEKDRQLEELREKEAQLMREVMRMRETIQSLTDPELSPLNDHSCREQMEALETDRQQLADRLDKLHDNLRTLEEEKNALACEVRKHRMDTAQLLTCSDGDTVTYVWNPKNSQYNIVQSGEFTYYLHESSYQALGLQPTVRGEQPDTLFGFGTVIHKEFCHARRDDNRYGVPQGACFYRVKLKPVNVSKKKKGRPSSSRGSGLSAEMAPAPQQPPTAVVTIEMQSSSRSGGGGGTLPITTSATAGQLIDSFAQTDHPTPSSTTTSSTTGGMADGSKSPTAASRDMIDSGVVEQQRSSYRERNISITDEEDGVVGSFGIGSTGSIDRIRYQSVCEEDDPADGDDDDDGDLADSAGGGGGSSATDHQQPSSCYASATDTTIVVTRTNQPPLIHASIAADSGNNSEASTASSTHPLATTSTNNSTAITATNSTAQQPVAGQSLLSIADDVSDSADSEYRSLEANDQEDSDGAVAPLPLAGSAGRE
uniref:RB1-inducible coiled-coil protein 1 n=1 Tax=Anopheles coluzzii TaxID=1518534 RepID=A0A6E8VY92_ANOCL